jgi:hypothetical protein
LWALAVVRRMQRRQQSETTVGVEIIGRRLVRVLLRNWVTPSDAGRGRGSKPFFGIYLPAHRKPPDGAAQPPSGRTSGSSPVAWSSSTPGCPLPDPLHADARASTRLGVDALLGGEKAYLSV